jgi:hypothetical protein
MPEFRLRPRRRRYQSLAVLTAAFGLCAGAVAAAGTPGAIRFLPGVYELDDYVPNAPVGPPTDTLTVTVSGGVAHFTLTGTDSATFSVPDPSTPTGTDIDDDGLFNPYYFIPTSAISASWDTTAYPWLTFWSAGIGGGVTAGSIPGDFGSNLFDTSGSTIGPSQVFAVPEPTTWALLVTGLAGFGGVARARRAVTQA